jgi:hypothetical protein
MLRQFLLDSNPGQHGDAHARGGTSLDRLNTSWSVLDRISFDLIEPSFSGRW